uniref:RNA-directed DNA polymerase, eukaryota, reverse transcriptase zinc-binding domain protein n=1 Tax=Tanacetum cinerariifolium TaxID=118510 RepID=A0A699HKD1_TANCI|nr:RNA-directed DNA polymerase, eukaryota, reverse transcriptase zinc-binding domain protein [Tanacetum cinerariifolium]
MIGEKIKNTRGVRLRGYEKRKVRKERIASYEEYKRDNEYENPKDDSNVEKISKSSYMQGNDFIHENAPNIPCEETPHSNDPFNSYEPLQKKNDNLSLSKDFEPTYPSGFTLDIENNNKGEGTHATNDQVKSIPSLIDLPLGGYSYAWAPKSASKTSKLNRFLISEVLMALFPQLSGLCLDKHLSDHRLIIMCELIIDYGSTLFHLSQKAKVRWSIEGDENSKHFHGNRKRSQIAIRGILLDGDWIIDSEKFPTRLNIEQVEELELSISYDEIKKNIVDQDIVAVVTEFFTSDFEKAFDFIRWDYLDDVLKSFGFGDKWRNWIFDFLDSVMGSVLINDSPTSEFHFQKGLKQGDPISPFLFISPPSWDASRFPSFHYLEVKVGATMSKLNSWKEITAKIYSRLSKWKLKTLSSGGCLTLLKCGNFLLKDPLHGLDSSKPFMVLEELSTTKTLRTEAPYGLI